MRKITKAVFFAAFLLASAIVSSGQSPASKDARGSLVVGGGDRQGMRYPLLGAAAGLEVGPGTGGRHRSN